MKGRKPHFRRDASPVGVLPAPEWLSEHARSEWDRVMPILTERRIMTDADLGSLESYCLAIGSVREMEEHIQTHGRVIESLEGKWSRNPAVGIQEKAMAAARQLAAELGLTPASRSRPTIRDDEDEDDLADLD